LNQFSISQLQQLSGIKAHTIRIWEQRYNALNPNRTEGNTRYYDSFQLRRLLSIVSLLGQNYKISELCSMSNDELQEVLKGQLAKSKLEDPNEYFVSQLIIASMTFDEIYFEKIYTSCVHRLGLRNMYLEVIYPMLLRIGMMWESDSISPAQEHFLTNLLRRKFYSTIDAMPHVNSKNQTWILFLPENEFHEIGLLFSQFIIRHAGCKVVYLGPNLPIDTLENAVTQINPSHLLFFFVHQDLIENSQAYINHLLKNFPKVKLNIAGKKSMLDELLLGKNANKILSVIDLENELDV
jgi:MerR family transcriptional regulator, light-induced transcriptional regulator